MTPLSEPIEKKLFNKFPYPTSHDIIKTLAVIVMIIDHYGAYFDPEQSWWRAIGRIGFPVWFYLIGYARSRDIGWKLIAGAALLILGNLITGIAVLPLNALVSIILIRLSLDFITGKLIGKSEVKLILLLFAGLVLNSLLNFVWEYGSLAFIFALCGHYWRNGFESRKATPHIVCLFAFLAFIYSQQEVFHFGAEPLAFMTIGTLATMAALMFYLPKQGPALPIRNKILLWPLMIGGRYTLEIYVVHLLLFKAIHFMIYGCASTSYCLLQLI